MNTVIPSCPPPLEHWPLDGLNLIEASAGTGKTWALCALYMRLLLECKLDVQQILVVTFTKAATAELRERIRLRIAQSLRDLKAQDHPDSDALGRLEHALESMDEAAIFTIHGFCQRALDDRPMAAGQAFALELAADDKAIMREVVYDYWRNFIASDRCSLELAHYLHSKTTHPGKFLQLLEQHMAKPLAQIPWPSDIDDKDSADEDRFASDFAEAISIWKAQKGEIMQRLNDSLQDLNRQSYHEKSITQAFSDWDRWFELTMPRFAFEHGSKMHLLSSQTLNLRTRKNKQPPEHRFFLLATSLLQQQQARQSALERASLRCLRHMLEWSTQEVQRRRRLSRQTSFDDMLWRLYQALQQQAHNQLSASLCAQYPAALIDEFQDTDPLQYEIFSGIYARTSKPVFFVGDPKQAIYSFRHADLHTYLRARQQAKRIYQLQDNHRSVAGLIEAVNAIFGATKQAFMLPGLDFHPVRSGGKPRELLKDQAAPGQAMHIWTLPAGEQSLLTRDQAFKLSARACAGEISRLLNDAQQERVCIGSRRLTPADIAVLVRTHKQGKLIKEALSTLRIASVELSQDSVFESQDAQALEAVLAAIHQPDNPALVRNAMATEIMGLDAQAIANHFAEAQALDALIERFMTYRDLWRADGFIVMFRRFLEQETLAARMLLRQDGERRLTNLLHLGELLHEAAQHETTPEALIAWLCKQRLAEVTPEVAQVRLESDRQLVQIITIHKSKGLEFPIVFCPFLWDSTSSTSSVKASAYAFDDRDAAAAEARKRQAVADSAAEAVRMIYVALTRAVHRCYLVAGSYLSGTTRPSGKRSGAGLLNWLVIGGDRNPEQWLFDDSSDDDARKPQQILSAWQRLASVQHLHMALMPIPQSEARAFVAIRQGLEALAEIPRMQRPGWSWRMSSYSAMTRQLEERERDHDEQGSPDEDILAEDDMLAFPKGPHVGSFLHQIFETIAFDQPNTWPQAIRHAIEGAAALHASAPQDFELQRWQQTLMTMLKQVLDRDLGGGLVLASIGAERRLSELEFTLPMADGQTAALQALVAQEEADSLQARCAELGSLQPNHLAAYVKGYIDLIVEDRDKFYLIDWKSNFLGGRASDYEPQTLKRAMIEHRYALQYLIYTLALDRYLRARKIDYCYEKHFGGVFYLFIRAIRPQWVNPDSSPTGVFFVKPKAARIAALSALFKPLTEPAAPSPQP